VLPILVVMRHWTCAQDCQNAPEANRKAEAMSRDPANSALWFMRSGDPSLGNFSDAAILAMCRII